MRAFFVIPFLILVSCHKDDPPMPPQSAGTYTNGLLVLNEGLYQQNNASISFYSYNNAQVYTQAFFTENGRGLGDTANDFEKYTLDGNEYIIIAVDISSQIEIVEANTLKSVAQIPLFDGTSAREPRRIEVFGYAAFVCCFDGTVVVIDLTTYEVIKVIEVGANPDGMTIVGDELFVSNSGGLNFPVYDSTISVIDLTTREVVETFETRINSTSMVVDSQNELYLLSNGNYGSTEPALLRIDPSSRSVLNEFDLPIGAMTQVGDWLYYFDTVEEKIKRFNLISDQIETTDFLNANSFQTLVGIHYIEQLNQLMCIDANGFVNSSIIRAYDLSGNLLYEFSAELNAKKIIYND